MNLKEATIFAQTKFREKGITSAQLDAEVLLLETINRDRKIKCGKSWMYLNFKEHNLTQKELRIFKTFIRRREKHEPVAYIIQRKEFYGLDFFVDKDVLIPRVETEMIVSSVIDVIKAAKKDFALMDIGTGSGCIIVSTLKEAAKNNLQRKIKKASANDISNKAIETAKINAKKHAVSSKITFLECDLEKAIEKIKGDNIIVTANLPYISPDNYRKLKPNVKNFEPKIALAAKNEGLYHIYRLLCKFGKISLKFESFYLFLEADPRQMKRIENFAKKEIKNCQTEVFEDLRGKKRMIKIYKK